MVDIALSASLSHGSRPPVTRRNLPPINGCRFRECGISAVARRNRGMAFEIVRAGQFEWGVIAGSSTRFPWATAPPNCINMYQLHVVWCLDRAARASESRANAGSLRGRRLRDPCTALRRPDGQERAGLLPAEAQAQARAVQRQQRLLQRRGSSPPLTTAAAARPATAEGYSQSPQM